MDGQYVNSPLITAVKNHLSQDAVESEFHVPVTWDPAHFINCAVIDIKEGKNKFRKSRFFLLFVDRCNTFPALMARGKGYAILKAVAKNKNSPVSLPQSYAHQR